MHIFFEALGFDNCDEINGIELFIYSIAFRIYDDDIALAPERIFEV